MKTIFTLCLSLVLGQAIYAQGCTELFISEYLEGSGNNKGFEIYNPTSEAIDLSAYTLQRWSNGASATSDELTLVGSIPAYGTWVVVNGQTTDEDLGGGNISPAVDLAMQSAANQLDNPYPAPTYMNGDDALVFVKNGTQPIDMFGKPGEDPGNAWTDNADAGYTSNDGGTWLTANHTLRRKSSIMAGNITVPVSFYALTEWDTLANDTWDGLGWHSCVCDPNMSVEENMKPIEFNVFPNPSSTGKVDITANLTILSVEVYDQSGRIVFQSEIEGTQSNFTLLTDQFEAGIYVVNAHLEGRKTFSQRLIIQ
jgi:hypothetical protein